MILIYYNNNIFRVLKKKDVIDPRIYRYVACAYLICINDFNLVMLPVSQLPFVANPWNFFDNRMTPLLSFGGIHLKFYVAKIQVQVFGNFCGNSAIDVFSLFTLFLEFFIAGDGRIEFDPDPNLFFCFLVSFQKSSCLQSLELILIIQIAFY